MISQKKNMEETKAKLLNLHKNMEAKEMKWMDKETMNEIIFSTSHYKKMNRGMQSLRNCLLGYSGGGYCLRPMRQSLGLGSVYSPSGGGPS